jgi:hypothetical protein
LNRPPRRTSPDRRNFRGRIFLRLVLNGSQSGQNTFARYNADGPPLSIDHDDRTAMGIKQNLGDFCE